MEEKNQQTFIENLIEKYYRPRNLIIAAIIGLLTITGIILWNYFYKATIIIKPNITPVNISIEYSPEPNTGYTVPRNKLITIANTDSYQIRVKPGRYYYIITSQEGYSTHQTEFFASPGQTYNINPILVKPLISENVMFPTLSSDSKKIIFLDQSTSQLSEYNLENNQTEPIVEKPWYQVQKIIYSPEKNRLIIQVKNNQILFSGGYAKSTIEDPATTVQTNPVSVFFQPDVADGATTTWTYDLTAKQLHYLGSQMSGINWLDNETIIYEYLSVTGQLGDKNFSFIDTLNTANFDGRNWQKVYDLQNTSYVFPQIYRLDNENVIILPKPFEAGYELKSTIHLFNLPSKQFTSLAEKNIFDILPSPDGQKILFSQLDPDNLNKPLLKITDLNGNVTSLDIYSTTTKSTWLTSNQIAVAIPTSRFDPDSTSSENIPDNFFSKPDLPTDDAIYIINIDSGEKYNLFADNLDYLPEVHHIFSANNFLYFQNATNHLYNLPLNIVE